MTPDFVDNEAALPFLAGGLHQLGGKATGVLREQPFGEFPFGLGNNGIGEGVFVPL